MGEGFELRPIDLGRHLDLCVRFREDSYVASFGTAERFHGADGGGAGRYASWLRGRMSDLPGSCAHLWHAGEIVGQVELGLWKADSTVGYVNLFYLVAGHRGRGLGELLDEHATSYFTTRGLWSARLTVARANAGAIRFYRKHGWREHGPRPGDPDAFLMEKSYLQRLE